MRSQSLAISRQSLVRLIAVFLALLGAHEALACKMQFGLPMPVEIDALLTKQDSEKLSAHQLQIVDEWSKDVAEEASISKKISPVCAIKIEDANTCFNACSEISEQELKDAHHIIDGKRYLVPSTAFADLKKKRNDLFMKWKKWHYSEGSK